jgi:hypothetical protein
MDLLHVFAVLFEYAQDKLRVLSNAAATPDATASLSVHSFSLSTNENSVGTEIVRGETKVRLSFAEGKRRTSYCLWNVPRFFVPSQQKEMYLIPAVFVASEFVLA